MRLICLLPLALGLLACGGDNLGDTPGQAEQAIVSMDSAVSQVDVLETPDGWVAQVHHVGSKSWPQGQEVFMSSEELRKLSARIAKAEGSARLSELLLFLRLPTTDGGSATVVKLRYPREAFPALAKAKTNWGFLSLASEAQATGMGRPLVDAFCSDGSNARHARSFCEGVRQ